MSDTKTNDQFSGEYRHEAYATDRRFWGEWLQQESVALDKAIITISSGAIGLSVVVLTQLINPRGLSGWIVGILILSWTLLLISILCVLISYHYSRKGIDAVIDELDNTYNENAEKVQEARAEYQAMDRTSRKWDTGAFTTFVIGILFLLTFVVTGFISDVSSNEKKGTAMFGKRQRITEGLIIGKGPALPPSGVRPGENPTPSDQPQKTMNTGSVGQNGKPSTPKKN